MNIFQDLKQKLEKGFEQAGNKSQRMFEMSKLGLKAKSKKEKLDELLQELGSVVYQSWKTNGEMKETEEITRSLNAVHELSKEIEAMELELNQLKNSNITTKTSAETVRIVANDSDSKQEALHHSVPKQIYLCPNCAYQVTKNISKCPHCNQQYY